MTSKHNSDVSSDDGDADFDEKDLEALAAMATDDEDDDSNDEDAQDTEFRDGSPTGSLMNNVEQIDFGKPPTPMEYDEHEEVDLKSVPADAVVFCKDDKTNYLYRAVLYLMPNGGLVYAVVTDKEKAWKLALAGQKNKKNAFKKKDEDSTIKRSVPGGKPWTESEFVETPPVFCTPSAQYKMELRKANAKAAKGKASSLSNVTVAEEDRASAASAASPAHKKPKIVSTDAPKKRQSSKKRIHAEIVNSPQNTKRSRHDEPSDVRTLSAPTDHPLWEFIDAAKTAMEDANRPSGSLID